MVFSEVDHRSGTTFGLVVFGAMPGKNEEEGKLGKFGVRREVIPEDGERLKMTSFLSPFMHGTVVKGRKYISVVK